MGSLLPTALRLILSLQALSASVVGTVRDGETGLPIPGALVVLTDLDLYSVTDSGGDYSFPGLPPGPQHLRVERIGYASRTLHAFVPRSGELRINVALGPEPIPIRGLEIRSPVALRGLEAEDEPGAHERALTIAAVRNHPLLAEVDVFQALSGGEVALRPESPSGIHIRGGSSDQTAFALDGIPVFSPYHVAGLFSAWNPDALSSLRLASSPPPVGLPESLSGTVMATTRVPGPALRAQGGLSNTNLRVSVDGPWTRDSGFLASVRLGFPGGLAKPDEASYLRGESGDLLGKGDANLLGGELGFLVYGSWNGLDAAAGADTSDSLPTIPFRNDFEWESLSLGSTWTRETGGGALRVRAWTAGNRAHASWHAELGRPATLAARRQDVGFSAEVEEGRWGGQTLAGFLLQGIHTGYRVAPGGGRSENPVLDARTVLVTPYVQQQLQVAPAVMAEVAVSLPTGGGRTRISPRARLSWNSTEALGFSGSIARVFQFAQSLRNSESVVGNVFPVDLFMGSGEPGIPVAHGEQGTLSVDFRPAPGTRLRAETYTKSSSRLLLVAPVDRGPFSTSGAAVGRGHGRGLSLEASFSASRYGVVASYGWHHLQLRHQDTRFRPEWGAAHNFEGGVIAFPSTNSSIRVGFTGVGGRRTTAVAGLVEWESCNLLDGGCEFGGTPLLGEDPLGTAKLPPYYRLDLGFQKHWHHRLVGRDLLVSLFGTVTNLLGRANLLTLATDPLTGERVGVEMRPLSPLVLGIDWRF
jgi:hypothetical protein